MRIFILFAPKFLEWPLAITQELQRRKPNASFLGLAVGSKKILQRVKEADDPVVAPLDYLNDLEQQWLNSSVDFEQLSKYEDWLGPGAIRRIITADRHIGNGLIWGGCIPQTPLIKASKDSERIRRYVFGLLRYLFELFEQQQPNLVFCYAVAGALAVAIKEVSGYLKIPFVQLSATRFASKYIIDDCPEGMLGPVSRRFKQAVSNPDILAHVLPDARAQLQRFRLKPKPPEYATAVAQDVIRARSLSRIAKQVFIDFRSVAIAFIRRPERELRRTTALRLAWFNLSVGLRSFFLLRSKQFGTKNNLPKRSFAYFPLHYDPESTTMVSAPMHTNQIAVIEALSKSLPLGMDLVVKEHIPMLGRRPKGFYKQLKSIPSVVLISPFERSLDLIQRAALTCTITGTAAWEAILLQKPTIIIGEVPFLKLRQGFVRCRDLSHLPQAVHQALSIPPADDERIALYLAALMDQSFDLPNDLYWGTVTTETVRQNQKILKDICDQLLVLLNERETA